MNQPILTFSPDGGQHVYAFTGKLIWFFWGILAIVGCCALALVKLYELAMGLVNFVLTANPDSLARIGVLLLVVVLLPFVVRAWKLLPTSIGQSPASGGQGS